jgi:hypothetical protein
MKTLCLICTLILCFVFIAAKQSLAADDCSAEAKKSLKWDGEYLESRFGEPVFGVDQEIRGELPDLKPGESAYVYVAACRRVNHSGIALEKGAQYDLFLDDKDVERWVDKGLPASPKTGVTNPSFLMKLFTPWRRSWKHNWLVLLGGVSGDKLIPVAQGLVLEPQKTGEFISYANDASWFYSNNTGEAVLKISRRDNS